MHFYALGKHVRFAIGANDNEVRELAHMLAEQYGEGPHEIERVFHRPFGRCTCGKAGTVSRTQHDLACGIWVHPQRLLLATEEGALLVSASLVAPVCESGA